MPYLYKSISTKEPYTWWWLFCGKRPANERAASGWALAPEPAARHRIEIPGPHGLYVPQTLLNPFFSRFFWLQHGPLPCTFANWPYQHEAFFAKKKAICRLNRSSDQALTGPWNRQQSKHRGMVGDRLQQPVRSRPLSWWRQRHLFLHNQPFAHRASVLAWHRNVCCGAHAAAPLVWCPSRHPQSWSYAHMEQSWCIHIKL